MCVYYTSLNKACPKESFPLPRIDQVIDLTAECELLSFLDAYSGYHHILLAKVNQPATTFITPFTCVRYVKMSFGLENTGPCTNGVYSDVSKGKSGNLEVYVDDIIVKTQQRNSLIANLEETFANLRNFNIKLNLEKCTFGVPLGQAPGVHHHQAQH
jgi:hypothetical protein